jgi:hypothetical protein
MSARSSRNRSLSPAIVLGIAVLVVACGSKEPPTTGAPSAAAPAAPADQAAATTPTVDQAAAAVPTSWTPEALEALLAPVALYPDPILSQVLIAATNPQEVLDAGNWLLQNQGLKGKALDEAAAKVGFTPPVLALLNFPDTLDMMCRELDWTTELGSAFTADQAGVLDAVQRLRKQAMSVGNLATSPQMTVDSETQDGKEVVVLKPASDGVVYVPQYDPVAVYAPPPATAAAPATTTTTTTTESTGHSTGTLVATGLLAFGAGMLVNEIFDDDDDDYYKHGYYYPNYGYGGMPYYPPYPYRPAYGNGYYPSNGYRPPPGYGGRYGNNYVNNGNVIINTGGNDYWNKRGQQGYRNSSPITGANPRRSDLNELNKRQPRAMPADVQRPSTTQTASNWKGQKSYAGATASASNRAATGKASGAQARPAPKVQGSYAGGTSAGRPSTGQSTYQGSAAKKSKEGQSTYQGSAATAGQSSYKGAASKGGDRGYSQQASRPQPSAKPQQQASRPAPSSRPAQKPASRDSAMSGADRGSADRKASQRGKQSMPQGARSKGGGGGGGGGRSGQGKKGR